MTQKRMNPAALGADRARNDCLAAVSSENTTNAHQFHLLGTISEGVVADASARCAAWIVSRYPVSPRMARALAELAFEKGAAR